MKTNLPPVPDFPEMEKELINYWKQVDIVERLKDLRKDAPIRTYYDGPITANNLPHYGHTVQWTLKDMFPRYWSMQGYLVTRNMGWDCQGIPVEYQIEKELGFTEKKDIERYGVAKFNELCKNSVLKYRDAIYYYETRLGRWFDETDMYYTMDRDYIESMWWSLKELYNKGLLYEGYKVVAYSTRAGTTLSTHEVNVGGYSEVEDLSVTVRFQLKGTSNRYLLAWTTTPWTLPGNLLIGVASDVTYAVVRGPDGNEYILAKSRIDEFFDPSTAEIVETLNGADLVGLEYNPVFPHFESKRSEGAFKVVSAEHATEEEGTGIVHMAPYGEEDFIILQSNGISLFDYLDDEAHFTDLVPEYSGLFYKDANEKIAEDLDAKGLLHKKEVITHKMPMCWRTDTPLIYRPIKSWYVAVTKLKDKLLAQNETVNWVPKHVGTGRMETWLNNIRDWALSRKRYWGTPLPVWVNDKTGEKVFVGSFKELQELSGQKLDDPHRPFVDEITWEDPENGGVFRRVSDVIDVWYDSGAMPFAQYHYPFENEQLFKAKFPAELVSESYEQARLWFYTLLVLNTALFGKVPYKNVVAHGMMLDKYAKKLSKSKRNFPPMDEVLDTFGGDILRYFIVTSPVVVAENARFYREALEQVKRDFFLVLWNTVRYFVTYAEKSGFDPDKSALERPDVSHALDRWILARLDDVVAGVAKGLDSYQVLHATRLLGPFVTDLSTWYVRRSRDRIKAGDTDALKTLYYVLSQFTLVMAPILPFISDVLFDVLGMRELLDLESVHLARYPQARALDQTDQELLDLMTSTRKVVKSLLSIRNDVGIGIRQPLGKAFVLEDVPFIPELVLAEVNVHAVEAVDSLESLKSGELKMAKDNLSALDVEITPELAKEGLTRKVISSLQAKRKKQGLTLNDRIKAYVPDKSELRELLDAPERREQILETVGATDISFGDSYAVEKI